jgi:8-hydroxy-5-deazaflavin:NADPH oxidoreductase
MTELAPLAIIGGTGPEGQGLTSRLAMLGYPIIIGSRSPERAQRIALQLRRNNDDLHIEGRANEVAADMGQIVILTIPYGAVDTTLPPLQDSTASKLVVSAIAPLEFVEGRLVAHRPEDGSAAQRVQRLLPEARVVSAFQTVDSHQLGSADVQLDTDIIVCSDDAEARHEIVRLAGSIPGVRALSGGRLANSRFVEECAALLITINRIHKVHSAIRLTGIGK